VRECIDEVHRQHILWATVVLACERGLESVTVTGIVGRAGVPRRSFYMLFEDREECIDAVLEEAVAHVTRRVEAAYSSRGRWIDRLRTALRALLELFEEQPELAELCVLMAVTAPRAALVRRKEVLDKLTVVLDQGRREPRAVRTPSPLAAEAAIGGALAILHRRLLQGKSQALGELLNPLMAVIVMPYLGGAAAGKEMARPVPQAVTSASRRARRQPAEGLGEKRPLRVSRVAARRDGQAGRAGLRASGHAEHGTTEHPSSARRQRSL
jgi:AcrR family transcriptional regulator